jgi:hypothetical protein
MEILKYEEWLEKYKPIKNTIAENPSFDETMFETYGPEYEFVKTQNPKCIWTFYADNDVDDDLCRFAKLSRGLPDGMSEDDYESPDDYPFIDDEGHEVDFGFIGDGLGFVNRMGYFVTSVPFEGEFSIVYLSDWIVDNTRWMSLKSEEVKHENGCI